MRKRNWKQYNKNLVKRGSITFFIDEELLKPLKAQKNKRGRPLMFSSALIRMLLLLKIQFNLAYRSLEGFAKSLLPRLAPGVILPTYSLIAKRAASIDLPKLSSRKPQVVLLDATGVKIVGEGEWKVKIHGKKKRRKWKKIHIAVDQSSGEIMALEVTDSCIADCTQAESLIEKCPKTVKEVKADGAYDSAKVRKAIRARGAVPIIPPPINARRGLSPERDHAISIIKGLGGDILARSIWGKLVGYSGRALVESCFSRMKRLYKGGLYSRKKSTQTVEVYLKAKVMNCMISQKKAA